MKNYSLRLMLWAFVIVIINSCQRDLPEVTAVKNPVSFGFSAPTTDAQARTQTNDFSLVVEARVTITKADGTATDYTNVELELYESDGTFYAEEVLLPLGDYVVTEIYLMDGEGTTLFAIPEAGKLQEHIDQQLPIPFTVERSSTMKTVVLEVLSTLGFTPEEFGFDPEEIVFEEVDYFLVCLQVWDGLEEGYLSGHLLFGENQEYRIEVDSITKIFVKPEYVIGEAVTFQVDVPDFVALQKTFSIGLDRLKAFETVPNRIPLRRINGRIYQGDVVLNNQEEVDEFGYKRYDGIIGNLTITDETKDKGGTSIWNLRQLQQLDSVMGDFEIIGNHELITMGGMSLKKVAGNFIFIENNKIDGLTGLDSFRELGKELIIKNNNKLIDYCPISKLFYESPEIKGEISGNGYNPSFNEIKHGECKPTD
ncbi:hypothetical protein DN752_01820 [Echinicola strongylocentroti]|uniref:Receptor L-domain domain-containing protein n=1 Tax=Echinicola strongylocentroti TaxID=1795355 RepID=A0A2Z4ID65_9BACT|nr:hypothetical protein [Echinicola strongylocentroti]AWW28971.1 hypothetical protein DN752_01820 [Echinicola strongylocentroti]